MGYSGLFLFPEFLRMFIEYLFPPNATLPYEQFLAQFLLFTVNGPIFEEIFFRGLIIGVLDLALFALFFLVLSKRILLIQFGYFRLK
ncbi:MAG: CPBP family intramembrane metalloprotease [Candidatus Heimdallarchaeota archaeon]|nr:CPBP family intramembrane metalloprotease [Candidatus Heimdallarchaeota archaeon]